MPVNATGAAVVEDGSVGGFVVEGLARVVVTPAAVSVVAVVVRDAPEFGDPDVAEVRVVPAAAPRCDAGWQAVTRATAAVATTQQRARGDVGTAPR